jgi:hypothetical protein
MNSVKEQYTYNIYKMILYNALETSQEEKIVVFWDGIRIICISFIGLICNSDFQI